MKALIEKIEAALDGLRIYEESVRWQTEKAKQILSTEGYTDEYYRFTTKINHVTKVCNNIKQYLGIAFGVIGYNDLAAEPSNLDHNILTSWYNYHIKKESERLKAEQLEQKLEYVELEQYPEEKEDWLDKVNKLYL